MKLFDLPRFLAVCVAIAAPMRGQSQDAAAEPDKGSYRDQGPYQWIDGVCHGRLPDGALDPIAIPLEVAIRTCPNPPGYGIALDSYQQKLRTQVICSQDVQDGVCEAYGFDKIITQTVFGETKSVWKRNHIVCERVELAGYMILCGSIRVLSQEPRRTRFGYMIFDRSNLHSLSFSCDEFRQPIAESNQGQLLCIQGKDVRPFRPGRQEETAVKRPDLTRPASLRRADGAALPEASRAIEQDPHRRACQILGEISRYFGATSEIAGTFGGGAGYSLPTRGYRSHVENVLDAVLTDGVVAANYRLRKGMGASLASHDAVSGFGWLKVNGQSECHATSVVVQDDETPGQISIRVGARGPGQTGCWGFSLFGIGSPYQYGDVEVREVKRGLMYHHLFVDRACDFSTRE